MENCDSRKRKEDDLQLKLRSFIEKINIWQIHNNSKPKLCRSSDSRFNGIRQRRPIMRRLEAESNISVFRLFEISHIR
ncbi:hypothetical protein ACTXT7_012842 [Hymenolepis weldensis]